MRISPKRRAVAVVKTDLRLRHVDLFRRAPPNWRFTGIVEIYPLKKIYFKEVICVSLLLNLLKKFQLNRLPR